MERYFKTMRLIGLAFLAACGGVNQTGERPEVIVPERSHTAGDALLDRVPAGADLVVEIDLERMRQNPTLGPLVRAWAERGGLGLDLDLLGGTDAILIAVYGIGAGKPSYLSLVRGVQEALPSGEWLDDEVAAIGPPKLLARTREVARGQAEALSSDDELMRVRTLAMPARAAGASLRAAGRFGFDERVALSRAFQLAAVPTAVSVWGDVADDLAVVGIFEGEDEEEARDLAEILTELRERAASSPILARLVLGYVVRLVEIRVVDEDVEVTFVVGPNRLGMIADRLTRRLEEQAQ